MVLWQNPKLSAREMRKQFPMDLEYQAIYIQEKGKKKGKSDLTRRNFLSFMNNECLI